MRSHAFWAEFCFPKILMQKPSSSVPKNSSGVVNKDSKEIVQLQWSLSYGPLTNIVGVFIKPH